MLEGPMRDMLVVMLEWHIGMKTKFTANAGKFGKYFEQYVEKMSGSSLKGHFQMQSMKIFGIHFS